jgi:hypothetical protein
MYLVDRHVAIYPCQTAGAREIGESVEFIVESCAGGWWYGLCANGQTAHSVLVTDAAPEDFRICSARTSAHHTPGGEGWSLAGDVRLAIDPLSGNGILRAIQDGVSALNVLSTQHEPRRRWDFTRKHAEDWKVTLSQRAKAFAADG